MNRSTEITNEFQDTLAAYCAAYPDHLGLYNAACNLSLSFGSQLKCILGSWRQNLTARRRPAPRRLPFGEARVLIDASVGGFHTSVWLPTAHALLNRGVQIALVGYQPEPQPQVTRVLGAGSPKTWRFISIPFDSPAAKATPIFFDPDSPRVPIGGMMEWTLEAMKTNLNRLVACWEELLNESAVEAVISTSPLGFWSSALVRAAHKNKIRGIFLQQGLPERSYYRNYKADCAVVWSRIGREVLKESGWGDSEYGLARNPALLDESTRTEARKRRRRELGVSDVERLILILGQMSFNGRLRVEGYAESCEIMGRGIAEAARNSGLRVLLRQHPGETPRQTEQILGACGIANLLASKGVPLMEDIAAADLAISLNSTALEEAYLSGCPIIQVVAQGFPLNIDFRLIGAPLARESAGLRDLILDTGWIHQLLPLEGVRPIGDVLMDFLDLPGAGGEAGG